MKFRVKQNSDGSWSGHLKFYTHASEGVGDIVGADQSIEVGAVGASPADAILNASAMADRIMSDPIVRALVPPQVTAAIAATKLSAVAAKKGLKAVKGLWGRLRGKKKAKKQLATMHRAQTKARRGAPPARGMEMTPVEPEYDEEQAPAPPARDYGPAPEPYGAEDDSDPDALAEETQAYADILDEEDPGELDPREQNNVDVDVYPADDSDDEQEEG